MELNFALFHEISIKLRPFAGSTRPVYMYRIPLAYIEPKAKIKAGGYTPYIRTCLP